MAWRDQYRPASFRGVPFFVFSGPLSGGRRTVQHEYPDRDTPYTEDLGRMARSYSVDGYVLGADYMDARDALLEALEKGGNGELVHPYHGAVSVAVDSYSVRESSDEGGMARFSVTFLESGEDLHPSGRRDWLAEADLQAGGLITTAENSFVDRFSVAGLPAFVTGAAKGLIEDLATTFDNVTGGLLSLAEGAAAFARDVQALAEDAETLVQSPATLASRITALFAGVSKASASGSGAQPGGGASYGASRHRQTTAVLQSLADWGNDKTPIPRTTSTRAQQDNNQSALIDLVQQVATAQAVTQAARTDWPTLDEAITTREALGDKLDVIMTTTASDDVYLNAQATRAVLVQAVPAPDAALPKLSTLTPKATLPALVLAYQIHGDASRADELVSRNRIRHPGFVPGGDPLEILNRG